MKKLYLQKAYDEAKKDKDGYVFLEIGFSDDITIPVKGKLISPNVEDVEVDDEYDEDEEAFTSKWILKDIPKVAKYVTCECDDDGETLYWDSYNDEWQFVDYRDAEFNDKYDIDESGVFERIISKIDNIACELNTFKIDSDKYDAFVEAEDDEVDDGEADVDVDTSNREFFNRIYARYSGIKDIIELRRIAISDIEKLKKQHKAIYCGQFGTYGQIGHAVKKRIDDLSDEELGKMFVEGFAL